MKKTIFITGASSGIGKETAKYFQRQGWNVIATMRTPKKEMELTGLENVTLLPLDVTDTKQIAKTVRKATDLQDIDVVLNNAGYGTLGPLEGSSDETILQIMDTNLLGTIRVTKAFLPHLRSKKSGTIINVTSEGGLVAYPFFSLYHASKWAVEGFSESLDFEVKPFGIRVKTILPGPTETDFIGRSLVSPKHDAYDKKVDGFLEGFVGGDSTVVFDKGIDVARVIMEAATDDKDRLRYHVGGYAKQNYARRLELGTEAYHQELAENLL